MVPQNIKVDYLVVGSGLTGAVIARKLTDAGREVLVVDRRSHIGGNVHDHTHESGIRIHTYGPHYFRTSSEAIREFVNRFSKFYKYEAIVKAYVDGHYENWPVTKEYIELLSGEKWEPRFKNEPKNFEEATLAKMPPLIYELFVKEYTKKQWGLSPNKLSKNLAERFHVRMNSDPRLMQHQYQGIPEDGYAKFMEKMLWQIPLRLNVDYLKHKNSIKAKKLLVSTGPIDEFFSFEYGHLRYRGQQREHTYLIDKDIFQPCGQVNYPSEKAGPHIRILEWKHMMPPEQVAGIRGTVITKETPMTPKNPDRFEYPFVDEQNYKLYQRYKAHAESIPNLLICGRLGLYQYLDMDHAIGRAMKLADSILERRS